MPVRLLAALVLTLVLALVGAGCSTTDAGTRSPGPDPADCARVRGGPAPPGAPLMSLVVDRTASGDGASLGPAALELLAEAQRAGAALDVGAVDGAGAAPRPVLRGLALDPVPGQDSVQADRARAITLACVPVLATGPAATPTRPGSDILAAIGGEAVKRPRWLLVASDGLPTAGALALDRAGYGSAPAAVTAALAAAGHLAPGLEDTRVLWNGMGQTAQALPRPVTGSLERLWPAVLAGMGARPEAVTIDQRPGPPALPDGTTLPPDPIDVPVVTAIAVPGGRTVAVPDDLLFAPGDTTLSADADAVLGPLARDLAGSAGPVDVVGHAADYGDPAYQQRISAARADAVAARLVAGGVEPRRVTARGAGATEPAVPERRGDVHDEAAAAANRRVTVTTGEG